MAGTGPAGRRRHVAEGLGSRAGGRQGGAVRLPSPRDASPGPGTLAEAALTARLAPRSGPVRGAPRATPPASARQCGNPRSIPRASSHGTVDESSDLQPAATGRASPKTDTWHTTCSIINPQHTRRWNSHPMAASAGNRPGEAGRPCTPASAAGRPLALRRPPRNTRRLKREGIAAASSGAGPAPPPGSPSTAARTQLRPSRGTGTEQLPADPVQWKVRATSPVNHFQKAVASPSGPEFPLLSSWLRLKRRKTATLPM